MIVYSYSAREIDNCQCLPHTRGVTTSAADIQDRPALPLADMCCAPLLREPITAGQAAGLARLLKALADPTRLRLVSLVAAHEDGEACVCDLTGPLGLTQPTISHHLKILVEAGIFTRDKRGVWAYYALVPSALTALSAVLQPGPAGLTALSPDEPAGSARLPLQRPSR
jgi:ArsR family transcriptional regulator, arsenate/arsenite/antimonite-responsive transcriptional repressor